jgi:hypothetical protein
VMGEA